MQPIKDSFPFRLGTTSYIIPDDLIPNVKFLAPLVDDIELVLFESDTISNLPGPNVIKMLGNLKRENKISYTIHLPLDIQLGSIDEMVRKRSVEKCLRVIDITVPIDPFAYIVHFHGERRGHSPAWDIEHWRHALDRSAWELVSRGVASKILCVETLDYPFEYVADIVFRHGMSVCLDLGHVAFYGYSVDKYLDMYIDKSRVIHLHGNSDGVDHKDIGKLDPLILSNVVNHLCMESIKERVLTLEVFGLEDFRRSMKVIGRFTQ